MRERFIIVQILQHRQEQRQRLQILPMQQQELPLLQSKMPAAKR